MKIYRRYQCDEGHQWVVMREEDQPELSADELCPFGHPAVTCSVEYPVDDVGVLLRPAGRIVDKVTQQRILDNRFLVVLVDRAGNELCVSDENYSWDDVVKLAGLFKGKTIDEAMKWWSRRKP